MREATDEDVIVENKIMEQFEQDIINEVDNEILKAIEMNERKIKDKTLEKKYNILIKALKNVMKDYEVNGPCEEDCVGYYMYHLIKKAFAKVEKMNKENTMVNRELGGNYFTDTNFHIYTWDEFKEEAKKYGCKIVVKDDYEYVEKGKMRFYDKEVVFVIKEDYEQIIAENRTYDQMFEVLRGLYEE